MFSSTIDIGGCSIALFAISMSTHILMLSGSLGFGAATILDTQGVDPTASSMILRSLSFLVFSLLISDMMASRLIFIKLSVSAELREKSACSSPLVTYMFDHHERSYWSVAVNISSSLMGGLSLW